MEAQEIKLDYSIKTNINGFLAIFSVHIDDFEFYTAPLLLKDSSGKRLSLSSEVIKDIHHIARILLSRNKELLVPKSMVKLTFNKIGLNKYNITVSELNITGSKDINLELALGLFTTTVNVNLEYNTSLPWIVSVIKDSKIDYSFISSCWEECLDKLQELEIITGEIKVSVIDSEKDKYVVFTHGDTIATAIEVDNYSLNQIQSLKY